VDVDVVPGSVTFWTVTLDDQRRLKWAMVRLRLRSWSYWVLGLVLPALMTGSGWFGSRDLGLDPLSDAVALVMILTFGIACSALMLPLPLWIVPRRVKRELPVGATLVAWTTESGLGVRTPSRLTFYPWSRLTQVEAGPVLVRCRQEGARTLAVPAYLPAGRMSWRGRSTSRPSSSGRTSDTSWHREQAGSPWRFRWLGSRPSSTVP
jgi:hypothetical protein